MPECCQRHTFAVNQLNCKDYDKNRTYRKYYFSVNPFADYCEQHLIFLGNCQSECRAMDCFQCLCAFKFGIYPIYCIHASLLQRTCGGSHEISGIINSLSKAFKQKYGISSTEYRANKKFTIMKTEKKDIELKIKGPKIVDIPAKQVIYIKLTGKYGSLDFGGSWQRLWQFVKEHKLFSTGMEHIAIYHDDPKVTESDKLRTDICLIIQKEAKPQGDIGVKEIKAGKFAMFLYQGAYSNLDSVYDTIYAQLLPENNLQLRDYHCFEKYLNHPDRTEPEKLKTEIYVPVE